MTHRERLLTALRHKEPDRIPLDLGSTNNSSLTVGAHQRLREFLGMPTDQPAAVGSRWLGTVLPDEAILRRYEVDARPLYLGRPDLRPERDLPDGSILTEWGFQYKKHAESHFFPAEAPFERLSDPTPHDLEGHPWPDPADPGRYRGLRERAQKLHENADYAVVLSAGAGPVHLGQWMRGFGEWLTDLLEHPAFSEALMDRIADYWVAVVDRALKEAGDFIDIVCWGDDLGTQHGPQVSPELYRGLIKPRHQRMVETVKRHGKPVHYHTCGSIVTLLPDFIDLGIDVLNPVQVSATGMDTRRLRKEFGHEIAFWGAVDTQAVLPRGTPEDVRNEVRRRIDDLAAGGGYVLCAVHNIQPEVPPENIEAMYQAALEFGRY